MGLLVVLYAQPAEANYPGKIAYAGYEGNDSEIYTINVGGGGKFNFTDNTSDDYAPAYSPGGKRIAYTNYVTGGDEEVYTIQTDGEASLTLPTTIRATSTLLTRLPVSA